MFDLLYNKATMNSLLYSFNQKRQPQNRKDIMLPSNLNTPIVLISYRWPRTSTVVNIIGCM